jgi:predicted component of type VI protein secretion system
MKLSLVVAQGVHQGKVIPVPVAQFLIGRDQGCQLRPSSPAVSKRHCAILAKSGKVFVRDFGSTNGTFINEKQITGEQELKDGDLLKVGPLEFAVKMEGSVAGGKSAATPKPEPAAADQAAPSRLDETSKEPVGSETTSSEDAEKMAAMLLATDDGPEGPLTPSAIPDGTTVFDIPSASQDPNNPTANKPADKAPLPSTSSAADAILRKYMRRPRT